MHQMKEGCRNWFLCFKTGNFSLEDEPRENCPKGHNLKYLEAAITVNPTTMAKELSVKFNVSHTTIVHTLKRIGKVSG